MASDIALVLRTQHRELTRLSERCTRPGRGFEDPTGDLRRNLLAHLTAALSEVYPRAQSLGFAAQDVEHLRAALSEVDDPEGSVELLRGVAETVVTLEQEATLPALELGLTLHERRRMGKVFRIRRDTAMRSVDHGARSSHRSQSDLYELARRAGVEQRSQMTQAQLEAALMDGSAQRGRDTSEKLR